MELDKIVAWLDRVLKVRDFDDVSNNGLQIAREGGEIGKVAFAVDGSRKSVEAAAKCGAGLLVVHHGISWGGGIKTLTGSEYAVVSAAIRANIALYAVHLPLDANPEFGHNALIAREMGIRSLQPAFSYHGNVIGLVGIAPDGRKIGICSGGGGEFAVEAKALGCDLFVTGEADWGEKIAAENVGMAIECRGHYETELYGIRALAEKMAKELGVATVVV